MASSDRAVILDFKMNDLKYSNVKLHVMRDVCVDIILGLDFQSQHECHSVIWRKEAPTSYVVYLHSMYLQQVYSNI